jgi:Glycine zipper
MPQTLDKTFQGQIIGGTFSNRENAEKAVDAFLDLGIERSDIQVVVQFSETPAEDVYTDILTDRGSAASQAKYYDTEIRSGKVLVVVYNVIDSAKVIDVFDQHCADFNPNGSRNLRDDVLAMTTGALVGAAAGGAVGALVGGPAGSAAGAAAGALVGGGSGAAIGKDSEHNK